MKSLLLLGLILIPMLSFAEIVEPTDFVHLIEKDKQILSNYYRTYPNPRLASKEEQQEIKKLESKYRVESRAFRTQKSVRMFYKIYPQLKNPGLNLTQTITQQSKSE